MKGHLAPQVRAGLVAVGAEYEVLECEDALADTDAFAAHYGIPLERNANSIVVAAKRGGSGHAVCVALAVDRLDVNRTVKRRLGSSKASFASAGETVTITGMAIGGVSPFGLSPDLPLWVDARVVEPDWVVLGGGNRTSKLKIDPRWLRALPRAEIVDGLAIRGRER
jgi:prolyl-tRNA editing enzyme YbaK/EbsC (Cys-tRNA(Pro) deacylase)